MAGLEILCLKSSHLLPYPGRKKGWRTKPISGPHGGYTTCRNRGRCGLALGFEWHRVRSVTLGDGDNGRNDDNAPQDDIDREMRTCMECEDCWECLGSCRGGSDPTAWSTCVVRALDHSAEEIHIELQRRGVQPSDPSNELSMLWQVIARIPALPSVCDVEAYSSKSSAPEVQSVSSLASTSASSCGTALKVRPS